jgi:hypothetical protein
MFEKLPIPLSTIVLLAGLATTIWGFINYNNPQLNLAGLTTGIPLLLGGLVMKLVELKPVPPLAAPSEEVLQARSQQATTIQTQIRSDISRYSYGANVHMQDALEFLKLKGATDADLPQLVGYREELRQGYYTLLLRFQSPNVTFDRWQESLNKKKTGFFGRDVEVELSQPQEPFVELALISRTEEDISES